MKVIYLKKFSKDLDKVVKRRDLESIFETLQLIESIDDFQDIPNIKKLVGFTDA